MATYRIRLDPELLQEAEDVEVPYDYLMWLSPAGESVVGRVDCRKARAETETGPRSVSKPGECGSFGSRHERAKRLDLGRHFSVVGDA